MQTAVTKNAALIQIVISMFLGSQYQDLTCPLEQDSESQRGANPPVIPEGVLILQRQQVT